VDNIVYIATTNYPEKLQERITNRPSRFDRRYQVELPSADIREAYLRAKLKEDDLEKIDLPAWLELTEGMSLSHLKELVISVIVMQKNFNDAIKHLIDLKKAPKTSKKSNLGFKS
jgi:SpoVK/Ycf46/Vps4 family AAA+-type ATPase